MHPNASIPPLAKPDVACSALPRVVPVAPLAWPPLRWPVCLLLGWSLSGCSLSSTPRWDQRFGDATRIAMAQQIIDPGASANAAPVNGLDGRAARSAMDQYQKSFAAPEPKKSIFTIGVGNGQ
jgi:hypothetical protein